MKSLVILAFAAAGLAKPRSQDVGVDSAQLPADFDGNFHKRAECKPITMLFARGTGEAPGLGSIAGIPTAAALKAMVGANKVAVIAVDYPAAPITNTILGGASPDDVRVMQKQIIDILQSCPQTKLAVGGYSQGAALTHRAIQGLADDVTNRIAAAFTFGDSQFRQDGGEIPNFPTEKTNIICARGDAICNGSLIIRPAHLSYSANAREQARFIASKVT